MQAKMFEWLVWVTQVLSDVQELQFGHREFTTIVTLEVEVWKELWMLM